MKRIFQRIALTFVISSLLIGLVIFWAQAQARTKPTPTPEQKIKIEDTILRREGPNKLVFKPEFEVVKEGASGVVRKREETVKVKNGTITGKIVCRCTREGEGEGSCQLTVSGNNGTATCVASGVCSCQLLVVPVN